MLNLRCVVSCLHVWCLRPKTGSGQSMSMRVVFQRSESDQSRVQAQRVEAGDDADIVIISIGPQTDAPGSSGGPLRWNRGIARGRRA